MVATFNIRYRKDVFEEIRRMPEVDALLTRSAEAIKAACGPGYETDGATAGDTRSRAGVWTQEPAAMQDNASNNTLLRCIDRGRI